MKLTYFRTRRGSVLPPLCAIAVFAFSPAIGAQSLSDQAKTAGAIPLTIELLDKIDKFTKTVSSDAATTAEWNASSKDPAISSDSPAPVINSKYPKLAAAFKAAGLAPDDFVKAYGAILVTPVIAELATPMEDKNAERTSRSTKQTRSGSRLR